ncbi:MAG: hypothetical protein MRY74_16105 [Neomegalonema sp.]|nr:hypothetical protein [Neomegalonema sp.]
MLGFIAEQKRLTAACSAGGTALIRLIVNLFPPKDAVRLKKVRETGNHCGYSGQASLTHPSLNHFARRLRRAFFFGRVLFARVFGATAHKWRRAGGVGRVGAPPQS